MGRLTVKWKPKLYDVLDPIDIVDNEYSKINYEKLLVKLGEYEDAEEQGLLLRLPIGIGYLCYVVEKCRCGKHYKCNNNKANARKRAIIVESWKEDLTLRYCLKVFERPFKVDYLKNIGKTVFLTEEEAEQALAKMKGVK